MSSSSPTARLIAVALAALMLGLAAWWNGQPFFYPDTPTYLRGAQMGASKLAGDGRLAPWIAPAATPLPSIRPEPAAAPAPGLTSVGDKVVLAGRSVYYGALLYASHLAGSLWWTVAVQALAVAWMLHLLMVRLWSLGTSRYLRTVAVLAAATPLAVYTGLLMPDVFAGLAVLATATLAVYWRRLARAQRAALAGLLLYALAGHASHVALVAVLLAVACALRAGRAAWQSLSLPALGVVAGCLVGALGLEWGFGQAVARTLGAPPLRLPHTMARLVDMGPGTDFLRAHCPQAGYAACAFADHLPTAWTDFLFSNDPQRGAFALADAAGKRRMADEQLRFVVDVVRHDPAGVTRGVALDALRQLTQFRVDVWGYRQRELAMYMGRVPPPVFAAMQASRGAFTSAYNDTLTSLTYASTLTALVLALAWARRRRLGTPAGMPHRMEQLVVLTITGVVANALVCATLASAMDRFQARVVWLLPFLALSTLAVAAHRQRLAAAPPPMPRTPVILQGAG